MTILHKLQQTAFTSQARSPLWISKSGVPRGEDDSWHLVTPSNADDEIPGAASHTPAPCGCVDVGAPDSCLLGQEQVFIHSKLFCDSDYLVTQPH